jgi:hypothetical protein
MKRKQRGRGPLLWAALAAAAIAAVAMASLAAAKDRNHDGLPDGWERRHDLSLKVNQAPRDQDGDDLRNRGEFRAHMDPRDADSDDDGVADADENAGTISAWDPETGALTIDVLGGGSLSGTVTDRTQIECESDDAEEPDPEPPAEAKHPAGPPPGDAAPEEGGEPPVGPDGAGQHDCDGSDCSVDDLEVGGTVREAALKLTSDGLVFVEIELG